MPDSLPDLFSKNIDSTVFAIMNRGQHSLSTSVGYRFKRSEGTKIGVFITARIVA